MHSKRRVGSVVDLVGNTPLLRLPPAEAKVGHPCEIWAKCEFENPGGSVKDRAARQMLVDAIERGDLVPGKTVIDSTSGNTGVAYSMLGAALGYPVTLVMPGNVSEARKNITRAYGTRLVFSSELEGSDGAIRLVRKLVAETPDEFYYPDQYSNDSNWRAHYLTTGPEILAEIGDRLTHFTTGVGTTGTVMGTGRAMKEHDRPIEVIAVEPDDAWHGLEGMKHLESSIVPPIWQPEGVIDRTLFMPTDEAWNTADELMGSMGLSIGHSAGGNVAAAIRVAREAGPGAVVATILCDRGDRYFSALDWDRQFVY